ncbi:MAG: hypothetical protein SGARI_004716 [Bacillariaceae sp.]
MVYLEFPEGDGKILTGEIIAFDTQRDVALIRPHVMDSDNGDVVLSTACLQLDHDNNHQSSSTSPPAVRCGEFVAALGAPLELENTVTVGIVSNPRRRCRHDASAATTTYYIQTDNSCHVGNSGGPLINMQGQVIGITAKKVADGIAYSIPIQSAVESLREAYFARSSEQLTLVNEGKMKDTKLDTDSETNTNEPSRQPIVDPQVYSLFPYSTAVPVSISQRW